MASGGKRAGAGRKPIDPKEKRVQTTISVSQKTKEGIRQLRLKGVAIGHEVDKLVERLTKE